jgi:hypothetical protein
MNALRTFLLGLFFLFLTACGPGPVDDDDSSVSDDDDSSVSDDDDDDDSGTTDDDDSSVSDDDDDSSVSDDDDSGTTGDDDDDDSVGDDDDASPVTFSCGPSLSCTVDAEYCQIGYPGVPNSTPIRSCEDMPAPCAVSPDCTCILANVEFPGDSCSSGPLGGDTVELYFP